MKNYKVILATSLGALIGIATLVALFYASIYTAAYFVDKDYKQSTRVATQSVKQPVSTPPTVDELLRLVNLERQKAGVAALTLDPLLNQSAQYKAAELQVEGWDDSPHVNRSGRHGYDYIGDFGKRCLIQSENLQENLSQASSVGIVAYWKESPSHYATMIDPRYESTGFGISGQMIVQHFCDEQ